MEAALGLVLLVLCQTSFTVLGSASLAAGGGGDFPLSSAGAARRTKNVLASAHASAFRDTSECKCEATAPAFEPIMARVIAVCC